MNEKNTISKELQQNSERIAQELENGKDVLIKSTSKGIKIQTLKVNTIKE